MKLCNIHIRDPFILSDGGVYYLYGSRMKDTNSSDGFDVYKSFDLENWSEPTEIFANFDAFWADCDFWAPEVHKYNGKYYLFASFKSKDIHRGTQILVCDKPDGRFAPHSDLPVTPSDWECLDGTLYVDKSKTPYIVFCHEWLQVHDGEICALELSKDLKTSVGQPKLLFTASSASWVTSVGDKEDYVTDGPFLYTMNNGKLLMLWSSFTNKSYIEGIAQSDGGIFGSWTHKEKPLYTKDGGHGMIFDSFDGRKMLILHTPNSQNVERPVLFEVEEKDGTLCIK